MLSIIHFISPIPPSVNHYLGKRVAFTNGRAYVQVYETKEAKEYKKHMKKVLRRAIEAYEWEYTDELTYVVCELDVYLPQKKRDCDNLQKCLLDAINENNLVYDDSMIIPRVKDIRIDKDRPRIEVTMYVADKKGIFKNQKELDEFKQNNCLNCKRFSRNCSIMKKALENKIVDEWYWEGKDNCLCSKRDIKK